MDRIFVERVEFDHGPPHELRGWAAANVSDPAAGAVPWARGARRARSGGSPAAARRGNGHTGSGPLGDRWVDHGLHTRRPARLPRVPRARSRCRAGADRLGWGPGGDRRCSACRASPCGPYRAPRHDYRRCRPPRERRPPDRIDREATAALERTTSCADRHSGTVHAKERIVDVLATIDPSTLP
jgi:hypothetical protein